MKIATDSRRSTNVAANDRDYRTSVDRLYAAGDVRRGQSLVVWAIREGRPGGALDRRGADGRRASCRADLDDRLSG